MEHERSFLNLVRRRCSVRAYEDRPVAEEALRRCLEAARLAPSACNAQPWRFVVVDEPDLKDRVAAQAHGGVLQGLGLGSLEKLELLHGRFAQATMADYTIPTTLDFPAVNTEFVENPYPFGPYGAKGAGELVLDGAAPALALAVQQAVGKPVYSLPLTPEAIMEISG